MNKLFAINLLLLLMACGNTTTDTPFSEASSLLEEGAEAQRVAEALMQDFSSISDAETGELNIEASQQYVSLAKELANRYPSDTAAALPLYRSAEVVRAMNDPERAAAIYQQVHRDYLTFSKAPEALFMLAFTYDEDLEQLDAARQTYTEFLEKYPNHGFADDSQMLLENLGKSDEEILQELEAKIQETETSGE